MRDDFLEKSSDFYAQTSKISFRKFSNFVNVLFWFNFLCCELCLQTVFPLGETTDNNMLRSAILNSLAKPTIPTLFYLGINECPTRKVVAHTHFISENVDSKLFRNTTLLGNILKRYFDVSAVLNKKSKSKKVSDR